MASKPEGLQSGSARTTSETSESFPHPVNARPSAEQDARAALLDVRFLTKTYGKRHVVENLSFSVGYGEVVGLLGPNGAGKTTTFRIALGLIQPDKGQVLFKGEDISRLPLYKRARLGIGYLPQQISVFTKLTAVENILAIIEVATKIPRRQRMSKARAMLEEFGLGHVAETQAGRLSGGEKRRLEVARSLVSEPELILLDEPFAAIDPIQVSGLRELIGGLKARGISVLLTDHCARETLLTIDRAYLLDQGHLLVDGTPQEVVADPRARAVYFGEDFRL